MPLEHCPECGVSLETVSPAKHAETHWTGEVLSARDPRSFKAAVRRAALTGEELPRHVLGDAYAEKEHERLRELGAFAGADVTGEEEEPAPRPARKSKGRGR